MDITHYRVVWKQLAPGTSERKRKASTTAEPSEAVGRKKPKAGESRVFVYVSNDSHGWQRKPSKVRSHPLFLFPHVRFWLRCSSRSSTQCQKTLSIYQDHPLQKSLRKQLVWRHLRKRVAVRVKYSIHLRWATTQCSAENVIIPPPTVPKMGRTSPSRAAAKQPAADRGSGMYASTCALCI